MSERERMNWESDVDQLPNAEDVGHYWRTGKSDPDTWIARARRQIEEIGGVVREEGFGMRDSNAAFMLAFQIGEDSFRVVWPVLPSRTGDPKSAKRQAATMLYHDVKAACMSSKVLGSRTAFFAYLMLPDGQVASQAALPESTQAVSGLLVSPDEEEWNDD